MKKKLGVEMAFCVQCGAELADGANFCSSCGRLVSSRSVKNGLNATCCPKCGEHLDAFVAICPSCGYELRGSKATLSVRDLSEKLQVCRKSSSQKKSVFGHLMRTMTESDDAAAALIREFPIPNTKEDLIEFIVTSAANIDTDAFNDFKKAELSPSEAAQSRAWLSKMEQAYQKALIVIGDDDDFSRVKELYEAKTRRVTRAKRALAYFWIGFAVSLLAILILCLVMGQLS